VVVVSAAGAASFLTFFAFLVFFTFLTSFSLPLLHQQGWW